MKNIKLYNTYFQNLQNIYSFLPFMNYQFAKTISKPNQILQKSFMTNNKQILDATQIRIRIRRQSDHQIESSKIKRLNNIAPITRVQQLLKAKRKRFVKLRLHCKFMGKQFKSYNRKSISKSAIIQVNKIRKPLRSKSCGQRILEERIQIQPLANSIAKKVSIICSKNQLIKKQMTIYPEKHNSFVCSKEVLLSLRDVLNSQMNRIENLIQFSEESEQQQLPQKSKFSIEKPKVKINQVKYLIRKSSYTIQNYVSNRTGLPKLEMKPSLMDYFQQLNSARQAYQTPTNERIKTQESQHSFRQKNMFRRLKPYLQK
ncbi:hypothetical protein pb186bvf_020962 [Paramecium bursaria]